MNQAEQFLANMPKDKSYYRALKDAPECTAVDAGEYHIYGTFQDGSQAQFLCGFNPRAVPPAV